MLTKHAFLFAANMSLNKGQKFFIWWWKSRNKQLQEL